MIRLLAVLLLVVFSACEKKEKDPFTGLSEQQYYLDENCKGHVRCRVGHGKWFDGRADGMCYAVDAPPRRGVEEPS